MINQTLVLPPSENELVQTLAALVGVDAVRSFTRLNFEQRSQITQAVTADTEVKAIVYPHTQAELAAVVDCAAQKQWKILIAGRRSKLAWGGLVQGVHLVVSTERLDRLVEHAEGDLTVTVEAGMGLQDLQQQLAKAGQFLPLDPLYPEDTTIGGLIATADAGSWRHRYGGVRDLLIGITFVRSDGQMAKAGGRVVKNVAGYDLMKLLTGAYGTLGCITQATFRVYPLPEATQTVVLTGALEQIGQVTQSLLASALTPSALDLLSRQTVQDLGLGQGMGLFIRFQGIGASVQEQVARSLSLAQSLQVTAMPYQEDEETHLWQRLQAKKQERTLEQTIICKLGVSPASASVILQQIDQQIPGFALIHAGSGLGLLRCDSEQVEIQRLMTLRSLCQSHRGFLSILEAPLAIKQQIDVWGYSGNASALMGSLKQQFDPQNLLNPGRFQGIVSPNKG